MKIEKIEDSYFVVIVYNYARIEFYSTLDMLHENITLSTILISFSLNVYIP